MQDCQAVIYASVLFYNCFKMPNGDLNTDCLIINLGELMYVVELFASVHVCVLMNLIYRSKIYAPKSCSARASTTPVPVCKCNVPLPLYLILYELHTIFLGII